MVRNLLPPPISARQNVLLILYFRQISDVRGHKALAKILAENMNRARPTSARTSPSPTQTCLSDFSPNNAGSSTKGTQTDLNVRVDSTNLEPALFQTYALLAKLVPCLAARFDSH